MLAPVPRPMPNAIAAALQNPNGSPASTPFTWGADGTPITADALARQRKVTDALRPDKAPTGIWSLLGDLADEGVASYRDGKSDDQQKTAQQSVADALASGDFRGALSSDFATPGQSAIAGALFKQDLDNKDPDTLLDRRYKQAQIDALNTKTSGTGSSLFDGTGLDAQAWNILQSADPSSREYATAYAIISQPKTQLVQTANGMVPVEVPPQLPAWLKAPGGVASDPAAPPPAASTTPDPNAPADLGAPVPGPAAPASAPAAAPLNVIPGTQPKLNEQQVRAQSMASVISPEVDRLIGDGTPANPGTFSALSNGVDVAKNATGTIGRYAPDNLGTPSPEFLKARNSIRTVVASYLYVVSGATANPGEVENQIKVLTPEVNDPPEVVADKKARLLTMLQAVKDAASGKPVDLNALPQAAAPQAAPQAVGSDPLGIR